MYLSQELYYFTKGTYKYKKSLTVYYGVNANGATQVMGVIVEGEHGGFRPNGVVAKLPALEISASRFKEFEKLKVSR